MTDFVVSLVTTIVGGLAVVLVEYLVIQKKLSESKSTIVPIQIPKIAVAIFLSFTLFAPLLIIQQISLQFVIRNIQLQERIAWYGNSYAVLATLWGWLWGVKVRPWVQALFYK